ncbi:MAG: hybrid sensor histidine kinase/response regulator [bacterium]
MNNQFSNNKYYSLEDIKMLIVDDDEGLCKSLKFFFEDHDCIVTTATTGEAGLELYEQIKPDIVLVDLHMPGIGGHNVITSIARNNPDMPIIVVSGTGEIKDAVRAMNLGAWEFVQKPILQFEELELCVLKALERVSLINENNNYKANLEKLVVERTLQLNKTIEELNIAKEKAEQSDKVKSLFLSQISHEIRTPLNGIITAISCFEMELEEQGVTNLITDFNKINVSSERIIRTIELILNMSEVHTGSYNYQMQKFNIMDVLTGVIANYKRKIKNKGLELKLNYEEEKFFVELDKYSVEQIFVNLIDNANKFTNKGKIEIKLYAEGTSLVIIIMDSGIGMDEEYMRDLFLPFNQEDKGYTRLYDGNGLGLALTKKYCELNNITIDITSQKNNGTTIILAVPLTQHTQLLKANIIS